MYKKTFLLPRNNNFEENMNKNIIANFSNYKHKKTFHLSNLLRHVQISCRMLRNTDFPWKIVNCYSMYG